MAKRFLGPPFSREIEDNLQRRRRHEGRNSWWLRRFRFCRLEANGRDPMDEQTKTEIWDLAAGTFIAVSVVSGMAFIIANAIH
jgi:hypothetical protein